MRLVVAVMLVLPGLLMQTGSVAAAPSQSEAGFVARVLDLTNVERQGPPRGPGAEPTIAIDVGVTRTR